MRAAAAALALAGCALGVDRGFQAPPPPVPVRVCLDAELADFDDSLDAAIDLWNGAAGGELFRRDCAAPTLRIVWASFDGSYSMRFDPRRRVVLVARAVDTAQVYLDLAHELGHVLGLAHDDYGIMKPSSSWAEPWERQPPPARVTDGDRARVRNLIRR